MPEAATGPAYRRRFGYAALVAVCLAAAFIGSATAAVRSDTLLGDQSVEASDDSNDAGSAEAFRTTASGTGQVSTLNVYLSSSSAAAKVWAGIYTDAGGHPGSLLAQGSASASPGNWNTVNLGSAAAVSAGTVYWIAILGPGGGGNLAFRDVKHGGASETSAQTSLTSLTSSWTTGKTYADGPLSAYGVGVVGPPPDTLPPTSPLGIAITGATQTSDTLSWSASTDSVGVTGYTIYKNGSSLGTATGTSYNASGLSCGTSYTFAVDAYDAAGNHSAKTSVTGSTSACAASDTTAPTVPTGLSAKSATQTGLTLGWTASTDSVGVTGYTIYKNGSSLGTATGTSYNASGLSCGTSYTFAVDAYDAAGNHSAKTSVTGSTSACAASDTTAPTVPTGLSAKSATQTGLTLGWTASTDSVGVTGYTIYKNGSSLGTATGTSYNASGLSCGTSYTFAVDAYDAAGNHSAKTSVTGSTSACAASDTTAPTVPTGLSAKSATQTGLTLGWTASTDSVGVTGYTIYKNGSSLGTATGTSYNASGLSCGTSYTFAVDAYDAAGNHSAKTTVNTTTAACPTASALVGAYSFDAGSGSTLADSSGNNNSGITTSTSWSTSGRYGGALSFNGSSSWVSIPDSASLDLTSTMTLEGWVKPTGGLASHWSTVLFKESPGNLTYGLLASSDTSVAAGISTIGGVQKTAKGSSTLPLNTWTFLAASYSGSVVTLYVNGVAVSTAAATGSMPVSSGPLRIGGNSVWGEYFSGLIDNVRVYNRALSAGEIQTDMNTPVAPVLADTSPPSAPTGAQATGATQTSVSLSWSASTDNVAVAGYTVYQNGAAAGGSAATSYTVSGLTCGTTYTFAIDAYDAADNRSAKTNVTGSTSACSAGGSGGSVLLGDQNVEPIDDAVARRHCRGFPDDGLGLGADLIPGRLPHRSDEDLDVLGGSLRRCRRQAGHAARSGCRHRPVGLEHGVPGDAGLGQQEQPVLDRGAFASRLWIARVPGRPQRRAEPDQLFDDTQLVAVDLVDRSDLVQRPDLGIRCRPCGSGVAASGGRASPIAAARCRDHRRHDDRCDARLVGVDGQRRRRRLQRLPQRRARRLCDLDQLCRRRTEVRHDVLVRRRGARRGRQPVGANDGQRLDCAVCRYAGAYGPDRRRRQERDPDERDARLGCLDGQRRRQRLRHLQGAASWRARARRRATPSPA